MSNSTTASTQNNTPQKIKTRKKNDRINAENILLITDYKNCTKLGKKNKLFNRLLENNRGLINNRVNLFGDINGFKDDLVSVAEIAFSDSLNKFDISMGNTFSTFLTANIRGALLKFINRKTREVSVPEEKNLKFLKLENNKNSVKYNNDTHNISGNGLTYSISLDSNDNDISFNTESYCKDNFTVPVDISLEKKELKELLSKGLHLLNEIEYTIITKSFGLNGHDKHTDTELGIDLGKTGAGIGFIKMNALKKIRNSLEFTL